MQPLPDVGKENRERAEEKTNSDFSVLVTTNLALDEPSLKSTSKGSRVMSSTGANSQRYESLWPSLLPTYILEKVYILRR